MMDKYHFLFCLLLLLLFSIPTLAQTIWDGPKVTFTKAANADWNMEENQDRITENVWITRRNRWSIFNIAEGEITSKPDCSANPGQPLGTRWAWGNTADGIENLDFDNFLAPSFTNCKPGREGGMMDRDAVLHLVEEDIYIDIKFLDWTNQSGGAAVSYERSTEPEISSITREQNASIHLAPNPTQDLIRIIGLENLQTSSYTIYNTAGSIVSQGIFSPNETINIHSLPKGMYYFQLEKQSGMLKFVKL
ncbi:MAG: T9SS type A sorting domain-containing protein [Bacteroidota bacterium]